MLGGGGGGAYNRLVTIAHSLEYIAVSWAT